MLNFITPYADNVTHWNANDMNAPLSLLDKALARNFNMIIHCDGDIAYDSGTGVLSWGGTIRILFNTSDNKIMQNTISASNITLADNEFAYVTLVETNDTAITVSKASITTNATSNTVAVARLVLGYRNTSSDGFAPVALAPLMGGGSGGVNVVDDTTPQLGGHLDLNGKCVTEIFPSSAAFDQYSLCYINSDGKLAKTDADAETTTKGMLVIALVAATGADENIACCVLGKVTTGSWTAGQTLYVSLTAGGITATAPSTTGQFVRVIGHALSATVIFFNPSQTWIEVA